MRFSRLGLAVAGLCLAAASVRGEAAEYDNLVLESWGKVRMTSQRMEVQVERLSAKLAWTCALEAKEAAPAVPFGFPTMPDIGKVSATCDGQELRVLPPAPKTMRNDAELRLSAIGNCLAASCGPRVVPGIGWQAWDLAFAAGQKRTVKVDAELKPVQLADSAKDGPCYAFTVPIRLGRVWARPAGKLDATVALGDEIKLEDVILVRPAEAKREGRKITLALDGREPVEDLVVVLKGRLPVPPPGLEKPPQPATLP